MLMKEEATLACLCKRGDSDRVVHDECRLEKVLLAVFLEEEVNDVTLGVPCLIFDVVLVSKLFCSIVAVYSIEIDACILLDRIVHSKSLERLTEIDLEVAVLDERCAAYLLCYIAEHGLCELHHAVVVCVCLVELHERELRVMTCIHTFVTENSADLEYSFEAADKKSLEVELQ